MKFEILMSTFNGEKYIKTQIDSILNQTYTNWKISIADDASKDKTLEIIQSYSNENNKISFYKNTKRLGPLISFYNLLQQSDADYVIFCDQDDIWAPYKLERIYRYISKSKNKIIFGLHNGKFLVDKNSFVKFEKRLIKDKDIIFEKKPKLNFHNLIFSNNVIGCMTFGNCRQLKKIINKKPPQNEGLFLDYCIALNISLFKEIKYIDENLINYRRHINNATLHNRSLLKKLRTRIIIIIYLIFNKLGI